MIKMKTNKIKKNILLAVTALTLVLSPMGVLGATSEVIDRSTLPRTVITTDGEVDDMNSVLRALLYANEMDIAGIVITSSTYHYAGNGDDILPYRWTGTDWIWDYLDDYESVYPNLVKHDPNYLTAEELRGKTFIGNITNVGEMEEITEGSEFLKELFLDNDPRTLYVQTWGGTNTTARALKSIEEEYADTDQWEEIQQKIYDKLVVYIILDQDDSYANYIAVNWPGLKVINDRGNFWLFAYAWGMFPEYNWDTLKADWYLANLADKGALLDNYYTMGDGKIVPGEWYEELRGIDHYLETHPNYNRYDFISEGDSPSFLYLVDNGLRNAEDPSYGGWGGRFGDGDHENLWVNNALDYNPAGKNFSTGYSLTRWFSDIQEDFASRADWCVAENYEDANHAPTVTVAEGLDITAAKGEEITLTAKGSDPDGDSVSYLWWRYFEADTYEEDPRDKGEITAGFVGSSRETLDDEILEPIVLNGSETAQVSFTVPEDAKSGDTLHLIVEARDDGAHNLVHYARVIVTVE